MMPDRVREILKSAVGRSWTDEQAIDKLANDERFLAWLRDRADELVKDAQKRQAAQ